MGSFVKYSQDIVMENIKLTALNLFIIFLKIKIAIIKG